MLDLTRKKEVNHPQFKLKVATLQAIRIKMTTITAEIKKTYISVSVLFDNKEEGKYEYSNQKEILMDHNGSE